MSGKTSFLFRLTSSEIDNLMISPPCINVAEVAILSLTVMSFFLSTFFNADLVKAAAKIPTPYSCNRIGEDSGGTICVLVVLIVFLSLLNN